MEPTISRAGNFGRGMTFEKNPLYWDAKNVRTPKVKLVMVESYVNRYELFYWGRD